MEVPDQKNIRNIERYLNNELSNQEKINFEAEIQSNAELREQLEWMRNLPDFLLSIEKDRLSEQVKTWMKEEASSDKSNVRALNQEKSNFFRRNIKIVASIAACFLLISLGWYLMGQEKTLAQQTDEYIALYHSDPIILRGGQTEEWQRAIQYYKERDFGHMIGVMQPLANDQKASLEQLYYIGLAHLYTKPPSLDSALYYFSLSLQRDATTYEADINWYSSLIYIKQGKLEEARNLLSSIQANQESKYTDKATELIQKLPKSN